MSRHTSLADFIEKRKPILWVGAGLSIQAGYPTIGQFAERLWREKTHHPPPQGCSEYQLVDAFHEKHGQGELNQALAELIPAGAQFRPVHRHIARLAKAGFFHTIVTTNYDRLIESALGDLDVDYVPQILSSNETISSDNRLRLIKIHGDLADWQKAILTGESYATYAQKYDFLKQQLNVLLRQNRVLFAGCSMLDERILEWIESLPDDDRKQLLSWKALLTASEQNLLHQSQRPEGYSVYQLYQTLRLETEPLLPDYDALEQWFGEAADGLALPAKTPALPRERTELNLTIEAEKVWQVQLDGAARPVDDHPLLSDEFLQKLSLLEKLIHAPLPCDDLGNLRPDDAETATAINALALWIGQQLAAILNDAEQQQLADAMAPGDIPLLRVAAHGSEADRVLALPWELIHFAGQFPVRESRLDLAREALSPNRNELGEADRPLRALVHIAAPEDPDATSALSYEEEAYRLVLAMQQAADDAVIFSDLGTLDDLTTTLQRTTPTVVHFTGHGAPGTLLFENSEGDETAVEIGTMLAAIRAKAVGGQRLLPPVFYLASCHGATSTGVSTADKPGSRQLSELGAVLGEGPSSAATLHREGCAAVLAYYGPVGDHLSTRAETAVYQNLVRGRPLSDAVREARQVMQDVLGEPGQQYKYPLGWAQLALFLRGADRPISIGVPDAGDAAVLEQELVRPDQPIQAVEIPEPGRSGFIARRRLMSGLRRQHRRGRRLFVLQGLGGVGKTALALNLIPKLGVPLNRIILLDASNLEETDSAATPLWTAIENGLEKTEPELYRKYLESNPGINDPATVFGDLVGQIRHPWLIYLDNAESLQKEPDSGDQAIGDWKDAEVARLWNTIAQAATTGGPLTFITTARYQWRGLNKRDIDPIGALRSADMLRMMRWFPYLRRLPYEMRPALVAWLDGHARALVYLEGILNKHFQALRPDDISEQNWQDAVVSALPITDRKLQDEDLLLHWIWKRLTPESHTHIRTLSALRRPVPENAVESFGSMYEELDSYGLITHFADRHRALHGTVSRFAQQFGQPTLEDHLLIGHWYKDTYEDSLTATSVEEAVYHLTMAEKAEAAAPLALRLANFYRSSLRYFDSARVLDGVLELPMPINLKVDLLISRGNLYQSTGAFDHARLCFQQAFDFSMSENLKDETISQSLHGLANALDSQGKFDDAVTAYTKALDIDKAVHGTENHPDYAASLAGLANALSRQGKFDDAVTAYTKALDIMKAVHGTENHPDILPTLSNLAMTFARQGNIDPAISTLEKAVFISEQIRQPYYTGNILFLLAQVVQAKDPDLANSHASRAKELLLPLIGSTNPLITRITAFIEQDTSSDQQQPEGVSLDEAVLSLLAGLGEVSVESFIRVAQRLVLASNNLRILTQIAFGAGKPGLELSKPTELEIPDDIPAEEAQRIQSALAQISPVLNQVRENMRSIIQRLPNQDGLISLPDAGSDQSPPEQLYPVLLDEAAAIIMTAPEGDLAADLRLVIRGLSVLLGDSDEVDTMQLPLLLLKKLPDQREEIIGALTPLCSAEQLETLNRA